MKKENLLYQKDTISFGSIGDYIRDYVKPGDYVIPVCGDVDTAFENADNIHDDPVNPNEFITDYDERLLRVYQRRDTEVVLKNIRMLNGMDPSNKGLRKRAIDLSERADQYLSKLGKLKSTILYNLLRKGYDEFYKDSAGNVPSLHIWIPVWGINSEDCIVIRFFDRIEVVIS